MSEKKAIYLFLACVKWQQLPLQHICVIYVEIQINRKM